MTRPHPWAVSAAISATLLSGCATMGARPSPLGRHVEILPLEESGGHARGELIDASPERLLLLGKNGPFEVPLPTVRQVRVTRAGSLDRRKATHWALVGGLVTSAALVLACNSVEDTESCMGVGGVVAGSWLVIGGLSVMGAEHPRHRALPASAWEDLRRYARFPQGLPAGLDPAALTEVTRCDSSGRGACP